MQDSIGLQCSECNNFFTSASSLLKHFVHHANTDIVKTHQPEKRPVPNLFPIKSKCEVREKSDENASDSGFEDSLNPLTLCLVTMDADAKQSSERRKKYKCLYCPKLFGWPTDLKRHILTHTGQRPYNCTKCASNFTRKSHLNKHRAKQHPEHDKPELPALTPIDGVFKQQKGRKQNKSSIKKIQVSKKAKVMNLV